MGISLRDRASCFFDPDWTKARENAKSDAMRPALGDYSMERFCLPSRCIERIGRELHALLRDLESEKLSPRDRLRPRDRPD
jgi:hypothetical protein